MKILAVDDDSFILELIPMILAQMGAHNVDLAQSGEEAIATIAETKLRYDCFLFDVQMGGMDGIELCRQVRAMPQYRHTPIIMLTAMTERQFIDMAFAAGATDFATKPFDVTELRARLAKADPQTRARTTGPMGDEADRLIDAMDPTEAGGGLLQVAGLDQVTSLVALGNYLTVLSASGQHSPQIFAVDAEGFAALLKHGNRSDCSQVLAEIAGAIDTTLRPHGYLMACTSLGEFVCVSNSPALPEPESIESDIQSILDEKAFGLEDDGLTDIVIAVGAPIQPGQIRANGVDALFNRVVGRAKARAQVQSETLKKPNIRPLPNVG